MFDDFYMFDHLLISCATGAKETYESILADEKNVLLRDDHDKTIFHRVCSFLNTELLVELINFCAHKHSGGVLISICESKDKNGNTIFHLLAKNKHIELLQDVLWPYLKLKLFPEEKLIEGWDKSEPRYQNDFLNNGKLPDLQSIPDGIKMLKKNLNIFNEEGYTWLACLLLSYPSNGTQRQETCDSLFIYAQQYGFSVEGEKETQQDLAMLAVRANATRLVDYIISINPAMPIPLQSSSLTHRVFYDTGVDFDDYCRQFRDKTWFKQDMEVLSSAASDIYSRYIKVAFEKPKYTPVYCIGIWHKLPSQVPAQPIVHGLSALSRPAPSSGDSLRSAAKTYSDSCKNR